ncbi:MAG TPA: chloride channel protein [Acidimicrobiales bacterium]|nr:chloride channel protein [Acidimicrobiales bacterium]
MTIAWRDRRPWLARPLLPAVPRLSALARRSQQVLLIAGLTGALTGLVVAGFERLTSDVVFNATLNLPLVVQAAAPCVGLVLALACLRHIGHGASPATSDEYIRAFHDQGRRLDLRPLPGRLLAAVVTLGSGVPLGYEGPSLYAGAAIGSALQRRLARFFTAEESKLLLVAGAAAGVAAIFKAPVTGMVFALEVPYQEDLARRMLLPAAISAAAAYVAFAAVAGTEPLLPVAGQAPFNLVDLGGAAVVGLLAGGLARLFIALVSRAKALSTRGHPLVRSLVAGAILGGTVLLGYAVSGKPLALGPGYNALRWALAPQRSVLAVAAIGSLRVVGTGAAIAGGAVGGLFIPLVIQGAFVGRAVGGIFDPGNATLFPVVGMAAFLGAGYRVPLASVVFVAEFTGRPGFVVPGLIAAVVAQLVMGRSSISPYQVAGRVGHLEARLSMPLASLVATDAQTVPSDATVEELFWQHLVGGRQRSAAVVDGSRYVGIARAEDLAGTDRSTWATTTVADIMRTDVPTASVDWTVADAIQAMEEADADRLAVCDGARFVGVVTADDIFELDEILRHSTP